MKSNKANRIKEGNVFATILMYLAAAVICFITLYPMYYVAILSLSNAQVAATMKVYIHPIGFNFDSYIQIASDKSMWRAFANTVLYVIPNVILMLITCVLVAYPLSSKKLVGRKFISFFLLVPMYFSGGVIPSFLLVAKLGLYDSPLSMILPSCFSIWNIILVKAYFSNIPETLRESAKIDGANVYQTLLQIYLPMSTPILAVITVYTIVGVWNSWFNAAIYLPRTDWQPLQLYLRRVLVEQTQSLTQVSNAADAKVLALKQLSNAQLQYAMIIFTTLPVLCTYPFFQRFFVKGIMLGSLKE